MSHSSIENAQGSMQTVSQLKSLTAMLIKDRFTLIASPLDKVKAGYRQWTDGLSKRDPQDLKPIERGNFNSFEAAWAAFGEIVDKGGVLFASYREQLTYGFSQWIGLLPLAKWCNSKTIAVEIEDDPKSHTRLLEVQEGATVVRRIELRHTSVEGWWFHESGERYPFEDKKKLARKVRRERFDIADIETFLSSAGAQLVNAETFSSEHRFCLLQHGSDEDHRKRSFPVLSSAERKQLLSLSPTFESQRHRQTAVRHVSSVTRSENTWLKCPEHIADFFRPFHDWDKWELADLKENKALSVGEVVCSCGSKKFQVVREGSNLITVATCISCQQRIVLYDLKQYPGTTLLPETESAHLLAGDRDQGANVAVAYEYPDESTEAGDDSNAITWCTIWSRDPASHKISKVLDHETA